MNINIRLTDKEVEAVQRLALSRRRSPRDQAAYLVREGLIRAGVLPPQPWDAACPPPVGPPAAP